MREGLEVLTLDSKLKDLLKKYFLTHLGRSGLAMNSNCQSDSLFILLQFQFNFLLAAVDLIVLFVLVVVVVVVVVDNSSICPCRHLLNY